MVFDPASLPRDPDRLIEIIVELQERHAHLQGMVDALKRVVYGPRSEKLIHDTAQLPLKLGDVVITETPTAANDAGVQQSAKPRQRGQRRRATLAPCPSIYLAVKW